MSKSPKGLLALAMLAPKGQITVELPAVYEQGPEITPAVLDEDGEVVTPAVYEQGEEITPVRHLDIRPVSLMEMLALVKRYPSIKGVLLGFFDRDPPPEIMPEDSDDLKAAKKAKIDAFNREAGKLVMETLIDEGGNAVAALAAIAAGHKKDVDRDEAEEVFKGLDTDDTVLILQNIIRITMPNGISDFFGKFRKLAGGDGMQSGAKNRASSETPSLAA